MDKNIIEAALEILDEANMLGTQVGMDDSLKEDIVKSFMDTGYLKIINEYLIYKDDKKTLSYDLKNKRIIKE